MESKKSSAEVAWPEKSELSSREMEIVRLLSEGHTSKEIASILTISIRTVQSHRLHIMRKMQFQSVAELVRYAIRNRIIEP
jgi:DNA-binding CsgD family transcriptional regulator